MNTKDYNYVNCSLCDNYQYKVIYKFNYAKFGIGELFILVKCTKCAHVYNNPRLKPESLKQLYNRDYYAINKSCSEKRMWQPAYEDYVYRIRPLETKLVNKNLLDIGCGMGFLMKIARDNGWRVKGIDVSSTAVEYAQGHFGLDVTLGTIEDVDFKDKKFDLILAFDLLEHLVDPVNFIRRCRELLSKDGILIIDTPNINSLYRKITRKFWVGFIPYHIQLFSKDAIIALAKICNLKIIGIYTAYNDVLAKRNLWRWFQGLPVLGMLFRKLWEFKHNKLDSNIYCDISRMDTSYKNLEKNADLNKMKEMHNNIIARNYLGDQLVAFLSKG